MNKALIRQLLNRGYLSFECGKGWNEIILDALEQIYEVDPNAEILQIKSKLGTLRMYLSADDAANAIIAKATRLCSQTCERCGTTEDVQRRGGDWLVQCDFCFEEEIQARKQWEEIVEEAYPSAEQDKDDKSITVWSWEHAPRFLQELSTHGGDEDWVAVVPPIYDIGWIQWLQAGTAFGCCDVYEYDHPTLLGYKVRIGAHN